MNLASKIESHAFKGRTADFLFFVTFLFFSANVGRFNEGSRVLLKKNNYGH